MKTELTAHNLAEAEQIAWKRVREIEDIKDPTINIIVPRAIDFHLNAKEQIPTQKDRGWIFNFQWKGGEKFELIGHVKYIP